MIHLVFDKFSGELIGAQYKDSFFPVEFFKKTTPIEIKEVEVVCDNFNLEEDHEDLFFVKNSDRYYIELFENRCNEELNKKMTTPFVYYNDLPGVSFDRNKKIAIFQASYIQIPEDIVNEVGINNVKFSINA